MPKRRVVFKYLLRVGFGPQTVVIPVGGRFLSVLAQGDNIVLYAVVNPDELDRDTWTVHVYPTGFSDLEGEVGRFLGTVVVDSLVFHIFADAEAEEVPQDGQV